ncbi:DMT family transporter [Acidisoma sp.]|uniref:DMT family transporter n=1 Tax=Acidisoma sp. TaxID=1872115 RepID=UPI002D7F1028|nr:DMT family transporter [Acidisoma sp.]
MSRLSANLGLLLAAAIWGGGFIAQSEAASLGAGWLTGLRYILAFLVVLPLGVWEARRAAHPLGAAECLLLLPLGFAFFAGTILQQWAVAVTSVTHVGFLTGLYVIFVPCLETLVSRRLPHPAIWVAALLALIGTWFLAGNLGGLGAGDLMTIISALCFAAQILLLDRFIRRSGRPVAAALWQSATCVVLGLTIGGLTEPWHPAAIAGAWREILYAGALSGGVAFLLQAIFQRYTPPSDAAVMLMSESLFAALLAALILGERLPPAGWLGCALLLGSLVLAQFGPMLRRRAVAGAV